MGIPQFYLLEEKLSGTSGMLQCGLVPPDPQLSFGDPLRQHPRDSFPSLVLELLTPLSWFTSSFGKVPAPA